jgi:tripeptidyl-peptidase-1
LVNDALLAADKPALGFVNPWIYGGAYKSLTDITSGSSIGCNSSGFPARAGWDAVTGWGTPVSFYPMLLNYTDSIVSTSEFQVFGI